MTMRTFYTIRCRCVACGSVSLQPHPVDERRDEKLWFCGCSPKPATDGEQQDKKPL